MADKKVKWFGHAGFQITSEKEKIIIVDPSVFEEQVIDISSGDPIAGVELNRDNLRRLLKHATVSEITKVD